MYWAPKPIPPAGMWQISGIRFNILRWEVYVPLIFAGTTKGGWSWRFGARWDDVDYYYSWPVFKVWKAYASTKENILYE